MPCLRTVCRAFWAAAGPSKGKQIEPALLIRSSQRVAEWAWEQPAFRTAAGEGVSRACAELGRLSLLDRALAQRNDNLAFEKDLWIGAGKGGHGHILKWLLDRAARLSRGDATQLKLAGGCIGEGACYLADVLRANVTVTSLDLCNSGVSDVGAMHLASALHANSTLTSLDLSFNHIGLEGIQHLACALCSNITLKKVDLRSNRVVHTTRIASSQDLMRKAWQHAIADLQL
mmetsp:Transcript_40633/g.100539  ORF Transcript_40633/g.100539 Transcript_40633/m.100539 type:complete len:231 (+) Transcript_40633:867-1559(+)